MKQVKFKIIYLFNKQCLLKTIIHYHDWNRIEFNSAKYILVFHWILMQIPECLEVIVVSVNERLIGLIGMFVRLRDGRVAQQRRQVVLCVATDQILGRAERANDLMRRVQVQLLVGVTIQLE